MTNPLKILYNELKKSQTFAQIRSTEGPPQAASGVIQMGGFDRPRSSRQLSERGVNVSNAVTVTKERPPKKKMTARRLKNLILNVLRNPFNMVVLVSLVVLFCLIVIPLLTMI